MQTALPRRLILTLALITACDDATNPDAAQILQAVSGHDQTGGSGATLSQPIAIRLLRGNARPVGNATIHWRVLDGGGSISSTTSQTDNDGRASVAWTLGNSYGPQSLLASTGNAYLTLHATATFRIAHVAAGFRHTCALATNGVAWCWGDNTQGQLGNGSETSSAMPVRVSSNVRFSALAAAWSHTCGLTIAGEALCWGDNSQGQAGLANGAPRSALPAPVLGSDAFTQIHVGFIHTCALTGEGEAVCWGANGQGQLGGAQSGRVRIAGLQLRAITTGEFHSCAIRANNAGACWGWNSSGELGIGSSDGAFVNAPAAVSGNLQFTHIAAGVRHSCAIALSGRAYCWGRNAVGETGQDPFVTVTTPAEVPGGETFTSITTGNTHSCGLSNQRALCWGSSPANGAAGSTKVPSAVGALQFTAIAAGHDHTCGVADGSVWCWGTNSHGQLGQSGIAQSTTPLHVQLPPN